MSKNNKECLESRELSYYEHLLYDYLNMFSSAIFMENVLDKEVVEQFNSLLSLLADRLFDFSFKEPCEVDISIIYRSFSVDS